MGIDWDRPPYVDPDEIQPARPVPPVLAKKLVFARPQYYCAHCDHAIHFPSRNIGQCLNSTCPDYRTTFLLTPELRHCHVISIPSKAVSIVQVEQPVVSPLPLPQPESGGGTGGTG